MTIHKTASWKRAIRKAGCLGRSALDSIIRRNKCGGAQQISDAVFNELKQFRREAELEDDLTLVVIKIED